MIVDIIEDKINIETGSVFRGMLEYLFGDKWVEYRILHIRYLMNAYPVLHCEDGPAVIKYDGTGEWWYRGKKFETEKQFNCYLRNKAFW